MSKKQLLSGFCANGMHEATTPVDQHTGLPKAICVCWETCACSCHSKITQIYTDLNLPREPAEQNPEYSAYAKTEREKFVMPDPIIGDLTALSSTGDTIPHLDNEGPPTGTQDTALDPLRVSTTALPQPRFGPTPTGRRARGQLEHDVLTVCIDFDSGVYEWEICTPKLVAEAIGKRYAIEPPSTGAIDAVWNRWEMLGFSKRDHKPSRFVEFIVESPSPISLEKMKAEKKRARKRFQAEQKRGIPRPSRKR